MRTEVQLCLAVLYKQTVFTSRQQESGVNHVQRSVLIVATPNLCGSDIYACRAAGCALLHLRAASCLCDCCAPHTMMPLLSWAIVELGHGYCLLYACR